MLKNKCRTHTNCSSVKVKSILDVLSFRLLGLDLIVRDDQGNVLDPTKHSTIEIYKRVSFLIILISKSNKKKS